MIAFKVFRYANIGIYGVKMFREVLINVNFFGTGKQRKAVTWVAYNV